MIVLRIDRIAYRGAGVARAERDGVFLRGTAIAHGIVGGRIGISIRSVRRPFGP